MELHLCKLVAVENKMAGRKALLSKLLFPNDPFFVQSALPAFILFNRGEGRGGGEGGKGEEEGRKGRRGRRKQGWW